MSPGASQILSKQSHWEKLPFILKDFKISTMLDIPYGDFFCMKTVNKKGVHCVPLNKRKWTRKPRVVFSRLELDRGALHETNKNVSRCVFRDNNCMPHNWGTNLEG